MDRVRRMRPGQHAHMAGPPGQQVGQYIPVAGGDVRESRFLERADDEPVAFVAQAARIEKDGSVPHGFF